MTGKRKYTKKSDYWDNKETVAKAVTPQDQKREAALALSAEIGTLGLNSIKAFTNFLQPYETRFPECIRTYKEMGDDPDVATALDATYIFVDRAFFNFKVKHNAQSAKSRKAAKFIEYCLKNMDAPLRQYVRSLLTYKQYGFALAEKVYELDEDPKSPYYGYYRIKKLAFRPQDTLDLANPFEYSEDGRSLLAVNQHITNKMFVGSTANPQLLGKHRIPIEKIVHVGNNITENNPFGVSPLQAVYRSWREKSLIQQYEVVGVSKDLGGMPVLEVPSDILNRASLNPQGDEAKSLMILQANIANLHSGEQQYMVLPSDIYENTSMRQYELTFKGVQGTGKQFDTSLLIKQRKKEIYDRFGAGVLIMGDDGGSYSMSDNKQTMLSHFIERDVGIIIEAIQTQIIPQLLRLNGWFLSEEEMPIFVSDDIGDADIDVVSSAIQRITATGAVPLTPEIINEFLEMMGMIYRIPDDVISDPVKFDEFKLRFMPEKTSRSGDGMASGLNSGTSNTAQAVDTSVANLSN